MKTNNAFRILSSVAYAVSIIIVFASEYGYSQTPAQQLSGYVDEFTGNFQYSVPLMTVPGPHGEAFPLTAGYSGGIRMNQQSSWIGLGWGMSVGEISRTVMGAPDDWKAGEIETVEAYEQWSNGAYVPNVTRETKHYYGPIYFKDLYSDNEEKYMDLYATRKSMTDDSGDQFTFEFPDYDQFNVSGPGIGGVMQPYMLEYANLFKPEDDDNSYGDPTDGEQYRKFLSAPEFRFKYEPGAQLSSYLGTNNSWYGLPNATSWPNADFLLHYPYDLSNPTRNTDNSPTGDKLWASNHIKYWTNDQLDVSPLPDGFVEYTTGVDRGTSDFEPDGIGAFKITTPSGMTYHYSLPAYVKDEMVSVFPLDGADDNDLDISENNPAKIYKKNDRYATSWKLTAITGSDFIDDGDGVVDDGDTGYWVSIEYGKWTDDYSYRKPFYGYNFDQQENRRPGPPRWVSTVDNEEYKPTGTVTTGSTELYYPKVVKTASHSAYFVYDIRQDEYGADYDHSGSGFDNNTPLLALTRLVLISNESYNWFSNLTNFTSSDFDDLSTVVNVNTLVSENQYAAHETSIEKVSLQTVEFVQDYSLCEGLYNNINSDVAVSGSGVAIVANPGSYLTPEENFLFDNPAMTVPPISNSGKLTLKEIKMYGDKHGTYAPSYKFEYVPENPMFDHLRADFFGYYKKNFDKASMGGYITSHLGEDTLQDAWSINKIITPLGGQILINYESDRYDAVAYDGHLNSKPRPPMHVFLVKRLGLETTGPDEITTFDPDAYRYFDDTEDRVISSGLVANLKCQVPGNPICSFRLSLSDLGCDHPFGTEKFTVDYLPPCEDDGHLYPCEADQFFGLSEDMEGLAYVGFDLKWATGGGLRVKRITLLEPELGQKYSLNYHYSEGILTTEPDRFAKGGYSTNFSLKKRHHGGDRHARPPMVGYSRVDWEIVGNGGESMGKTVKTFRNFFNDMQPSHSTYSYIDEEPPFTTSRFYGVVSVREDNRSGKPISHYDFDANDKVIRKLEYEYEKVGFTQEAFYLYQDDEWLRHHAFMKETQSWQVSKIISSIDNRVDISTVKEWDPLTGVPTKTQMVSQSDGITVSTTTLAHTEVTGMGSKYLNEGNKNLLTPKIAKYTYDQSEAFANIRDAAVIDWEASVDLWSWDGPNHVFDREALGYDKYTSAQTRVFNGETDDANWKITSNTTLLDNLGRVVESSDAKGRFNARKFGYADKYAVAKVSNSPFQGFTHTSYETFDEPETGFFFNEGGVALGDGFSLPISHPTSSFRAHTGQSVYFLAVDEIGSQFIIKTDDDNGIDRGLEPGRTYHASVWVHYDSPSHCGIRMELNGTWDDDLGGGAAEHTISAQETRYEDNGLIADGWKRLEVSLEVPSDYEATGNGNTDLRVYLFNEGGANPGGYYGYAVFDDFRVRPLDSRIEGFVYDNRTGRLTYSLDNDNIATKYEYDVAGNVKRVYTETDEGFVKRIETVRHFGRDN